MRDHTTCPATASAAALRALLAIIQDLLMALFRRVSKPPKIANHELPIACDNRTC